LGSSAFSGRLPIKAACNIAGTTNADYNWLVANDEGFAGGLYYNQVQVTGTLSPDATGVYTCKGLGAPAGVYLGISPYYQRGSDNYFLWRSSNNQWYLSTLLGSGTPNRWNNSTGNVTGIYDPYGTATGTTTVANVTASGLIQTTQLRAANSGVIEFLGTNAGKITGQYLRFDLRRKKPTRDYVRVYGTLLTPWTGSASADTLTKTSHGIANDTPFCCRSVGGTLPAPLQEDRMYYARNVGTNTLQAAYTSGGAAIDLTTDGTGTIQIWTGHSNTSTDTVNVLDDVTSDIWATSDNAVLVDAGPAAYDQQRVTLSAIAAGTMQLSANVAAGKYPTARLYRVESNVKVLSNANTSTAPIVDLSSATASGDVLSCSLRNIAGSGTSFYGMAVANGSSYTLDGIVSGCYYVALGSVGITNSGLCVGNNQVFSSCESGVNSGTVAGSVYAYNTARNGRNSGFLFGNTYGFENSIGCNNSGSILGCQFGFHLSEGENSGEISACVSQFYGSSVVAKLGTTGVCTYGFNASGKCRGYGISPDSPTQVIGYAYPYSGDVILYDVADSNGTPQPGYLKAWTPGGTTASVAYSAGTHGTPPVSLAIIHESTYESALANNFVEWEINGSSGLAITATLYVKSSATGMTTRPTIAICSPRYPRWNASGILASGTAADNTDWQTVTASYTPTADGPLVVRVYGCNASGTTYWWQQTRVKASAFTGAIPKNIRKGITIDDITGTLPVGVAP
jgi:hypothetical protein